MKLRRAVASASASARAVRRRRRRRRRKRRIVDSGAAGDVSRAAPGRDRRRDQPLGADTRRADHRAAGAGCSRRPTTTSRGRRSGWPTCSRPRSPSTRPTTRRPMARWPGRSPINDTDNYLAYLGLSALASARHDFAGAKTFAEQGLTLNSYSPLLYGALSDAEIQLGNYDAGFASIDKMISLRPDTASLTRASYAAELRGDVAGPPTLMQRALDRAPDRRPTGRSRSSTSASWRSTAATSTPRSTFYNRRSAESPLDPAALAGKAKAEAALGQTETALDHYAAARRPLPRAELRARVRRAAAVARPHRRGRRPSSTCSSPRSSCSRPTASSPTPRATLFDAAHGDPAQALADAAAGHRHPARSW